MLKSWKTWVLVTLLIGPYAVYVGLGFLWLFQKGWIPATLAGLAGLVAGAVFYYLAAKWTKTERPILPPINWDAPSTFAPIDRQAWEIVEEETEKAQIVTVEALQNADLYIDTGKRLARRLAKHYHPLSEEPLHDVPIIELLTALELAAEDLNRLCRQIPGGDIVTAGHWKTAVQAAGYINKANSLYSYILPLFNPLTGISRLASQHLMIKPAWKTMQQNLFLWFYEAYVNRLGIHLIELYSGRLVIGAEQYRALSRKMGGEPVESTSEAGPLTIAVVGTRESGHEELVDAIETIRRDDRDMFIARLRGTGLSEDLLENLIDANWVAAPAYHATIENESSRDKSARRHAVEKAVEADLVLLWVDDRKGTLAADAAFAAEWDRWYVEHPSLERPPLLVAMLAVDRPRLDAARAVMPPIVTEIVAIDPRPQTWPERLQVLLPALAIQYPRAKRASIIRHLHRLSQRSKIGRLARQVSDTGKWLFQNIRRPSAPKHEPQEKTHV